MCHLVCWHLLQDPHNHTATFSDATEAGDQNLGPGQGLWPCQICSLTQRSAGEVRSPPVGTVSLGMSLSSSPEVASARASCLLESSVQGCGFNHIFTAKELSQNHSEGFDINDTACACKTSPLPD